jgi:hypothetical protein
LSSSSSRNAKSIWRVVALVSSSMVYVMCICRFSLAVFKFGESQTDKS